MKSKFTLFLGAFLVIFSSIFAKEVPLQEAQVVAKNFIYQKTGVQQSQIILLNETISKNNTVVYYVFNIKEGGYVIVAADDNYTPIIGYSLTHEFKTENQPANVAWWMQQYEDAILYSIENNVEAEDANLWDFYNKSFQEFSEEVAPSSKTIIVDPLTADILWDQGAGWNDACPEDEAGPGGHAYAGCVATAMSIVMKYWNYPIEGEGSHSYYAYGYGTQTANFGNTTYMWGYMDDAPNWYVAYLMYHAGVSVDMGYSGDGSGAFSYDVDDALEDYFDYDLSAQYVSKSDFTTTEWNDLLKDDLDNAQPVYYSGRDEDNGGHAFVCDGYDDSDYFNFNFGWSGSNNGFYSLSSVGGFYFNQAAVINIIPAGNYNYPPTPGAVTAEVDTFDLSSFTVNVDWEASKEVTGYNIFRGDEEIESNLSASTYTDTEADIDNHYYGIKAVYDDGGVSLSSYDIANASYNIIFNVSDGTSGIHMASVEFDDRSAYTGFGSANFPNTFFGYDKEYTVTADGFPVYNGTVDNIYKNMTVYVVLGQTDIEENDAIVVAYPNPTNGIVFLSGIDNSNSVKVFDTNGKVVYEQTNVENNSEINLLHLDRGIYVMNIESNGQTVNHKIVIK